MLLSCSISYCQTSGCDCDSSCISTGSQENTDSVLIAISDIRLANEKLIEAKYYKVICKEQNEIIDLKRLYILEQDSIINDLQLRIIDTTDLNTKLQKDYEKQKKKTVVWGSIGGATAVCFVGCLIGLICK